MHGDTDDDTVARKDRESSMLRLSKYDLGPTPTGKKMVIVLLVAAKALRALCTSMASDLIHDFDIPVLVYVWLLLVGAAGCFLLLYRPWKDTQKITSRDWLRIGTHAVITSISLVLWHFGLKYFNPLRTLIASEYADLTSFAVLQYVFAKVQSTKTRGMVFVGIAYALLFVMAVQSFHVPSFENTVLATATDAANPAVTTAAGVPEGVAEGASAEAVGQVVRRLLQDVVPPSVSVVPTRLEDVRSTVDVNSMSKIHQFIGIPESLVGFGCLLGSIGLSLFSRSFARRLGIEIGGHKRLHVLSTTMGAALMTPLALTQWLISTAESVAPLSTPGFAWRYACIVVFFSVFNYFADQAVTNKMTASLSTQVGYAVTIAVSYGCELWAHGDANLLSLVAAACMLAGMNVLLSPDASDTAIIPMYSSAAATHHPTSTVKTLFSVLAQITTGADTRRIFFFMCINLAFMFIEMLYGYWTNSLSLISDAFHMLFDCTALAIALYCAVIAKWDSDSVYSYGYGRYEVLSGFVNAVFLVFISFFVFVEAFERLLDPPDVSTDRLFIVAVLGLGVNLIGLTSFGASAHGHSHAGGGGHSHGHSHGGDEPHDDEDNHAIEDLGMRGVYLHVLADTLGSVGVIVSAVLMKYFHWLILDPLVSIFIGWMIFTHTLPLLKQSTAVLLQRVPHGYERKQTTLLTRIKAVEGVTGTRDLHIWRNHEKMVVASIHVQVDAAANEQRVLQQVSNMMREKGIDEVTVQIEKEEFFRQMQHHSTIYPGSHTPGPIRIPVLGAPGSGAGMGGMLDSASMLEGMGGMGAI